MNAKAHVLVIDDDAVVGRSFDRVLSGKGYEVDTALTGEEALREIDHEHYDVVFTDIKMPGMDGLEVAERIRAKCPWTPVVVITGYGTEENEARASVLGVSGFVRKPLTPEMIESVTLKALEKTATLDEAANEPEVVAAEAAATPDTPMITLGTAHAAKFPDAVEEATGHRPELPARMADLYERPERLSHLPNDLAVLEDHIRKERRT